jgi:hypothetical protein
MVPETIVKKQEPNNPSMYQRGFTLMGLMATLAVVAAMLAFVAPSPHQSGQGSEHCFLFGQFLVLAGYERQWDY